MMRLIAMTLFIAMCSAAVAQTLPPEQSAPNVLPQDDFQAPVDQMNQPQQPPQTEQPQQPEVVQAPTDPLLEGFFEDINYNPTDRRDPFLPYINPELRLALSPEIPLEPLQKVALGELKLVGIIWDVGKPKALVADPAGKSHIIVENSKIGTERGYVAAIREGEVIVVEPLISPEGLKSFQTKVLKLSNVSMQQGVN